VSEDEAREVVEEQLLYWRHKHVSSMRACEALGIRPRKASWAEARAYMLRWWLRNHDAA